MLIGFCGPQLDLETIYQSTDALRIMVLRPGHLRQHWQKANLPVPFSVGLGLGTSRTLVSGFITR